MKPVSERNGFTLIELLVVVAIITALLAILLPSLGKAMGIAQVAACSSNHRQISVACSAYAADNVLAFVSPLTGSTNPYYGTDHDWVDNDDANPEQLEHLEAGKLWKYLQTPDVYRCPTDPRDASYLRSYSINDRIGGKGYYAKAAYSVNQLQFASSTLVSLEELDLRGLNAGSWVIYATGNARWVDWPGDWHDAGITLGFADGHAVYYQFEDDRTAEISTYHELQPNNPDRDYMQRITDPFSG